MFGCYDAENGSELCCGIQSGDEALKAAQRHANNTRRAVEVAGGGEESTVIEPAKAAKKARRAPQIVAGVVPEHLRKPLPAQPRIRDVLKAQILEQLDRIRAEVAMATDSSKLTAGDFCAVLHDLDHVHAFGRKAGR